jgi:hypothetical protein
MSLRIPHGAWLLVAAGIVTATALVLYHLPPAVSETAPPPGRAEEDGAPPPVRTLPPAAQLRIRAVPSEAKSDSLLAPEADAWQAAPATVILLSRTPRIYQTEPVQDRPAPTCAVRVVRSGGKLYLRMNWQDATRNAPTAPPARTGQGGEPKQLYKRPTGETATFPDAAAVMVPDGWRGPAFPSLLMGDKHTPARLYYWNASRGTDILTASGRATPQPTDRPFAHRARHSEGSWTVTMELPDLPDGYPLAFALWDGELGDRDGLKCFSVWYVLNRE